MAPKECRNCSPWSEVDFWRENAHAVSAHDVSENARIVVVARRRIGIVVCASFFDPEYLVMGPTEKTGLLTSQVGDLEAPAILPLEEDANGGFDESKEAGGSCSKLWNGYVDALDKFPIVVKSVTAFLILATADATGQLVEVLRGTADSNSLDVLRMMRFGLLGLCGTPFFHFYFMWLDNVLPPTPEPWTRRTFVKLFIDQGLQAPCTTLAIFVFVGLLEGKTFSELGLQLKQDYLSTLIANWKLFVPAQLINMAFCPPSLRVLFINVVFFFWSIILSVILHKDQAPAS